MRPDAPVEGTPDPPRWFHNQPFVANVRAAGSAVGLDFSLGCTRTPNTQAAHQLLSYAREVSSAKQHETAEVLFRQYHADGMYPDQQTLALAAEEAGLDLEAAEEAISSEARAHQVNQEWQQSADFAPLGFRGGVPFFIVDGEVGLSGAQQPEAFLRAFGR